jgi:adenosylhomocysteine nucleosidase
MKIVSTFAVASEFAPWRHMRAFHRVDADRTPVYAARLGSNVIYAVITGIGMRNIDGRFERLLSDADVCIASGLAGGLKATHRTGAVLVARSVTTSASENAIATDERLVQLSVRCGATPVDAFRSVDAILTSSPAKQRLSSCADAVDIESFDVIQHAEQCGVPAVAIRAISDSVEKDVPLDFNKTMDARGGISWSSAIMQLAKAPQRLPELVQFGRDSLRAARNLAGILDCCVTEMT